MPRVALRGRDVAFGVEFSLLEVVGGGTLALVEEGLLGLVDVHGEVLSGLS